MNDAWHCEQCGAPSDFLFDGLCRDCYKKEVKAKMKVYIKWRIVAFHHPEEEKSIISRRNLTSEELMEAVEYAMRYGANLMSIRGFEPLEVEGGTKK